MAETPATLGDAREVFSETLKQYGFSTEQINALIPQIVDWQSIYTPTQIVQDLLPTTTVYQQRFNANEARIKAGLKPLTPSEYLATERSYRSIMRDAGLPSGFYDSSDDFSKFIQQDVSATELKSRVDSAAKAVNNSDPFYRQALREMYGIDEGLMIANVLDPDRALPFVEKQAKAIEYGAAAKAQGLQANVARLEQMASAPIATGYSATQGFSAIAGMLPQAERLGQIYGEDYNQATAEQEVFGGLASAKRKRQKLGEMETATFSGQSGLSAGSLKANKSAQF
jgi:hypothetical protein